MMSTSALKLGTLRATIDSKLIGNFHRELLAEKLSEFNELLTQRKSELDQEVSVFPHQTMVHAESEEEEVEKSHQQLELDKLYTMYQERLDQLFRKFQREWRNDPRTKPEEMSPPADGVESVYLSQILGDALRRALAELCQTRPADPIEYLSSWLRQYAMARIEQRQAAVDELKLQLLQEENQLAMETKELMVRERHQIRQEEQRRREIFLARSQQIAEIQQTPDKLEQTTEDQGAGAGADPDAGAGADADPDPDGQKADDQVEQNGPTSDVTETPDTESASAATKRVTVKESENSLYTIEEKENETNNGNTTTVEASEDVVQDAEPDER